MKSRNLYDLLRVFGQFHLCHDDIPNVGGRHWLTKGWTFEELLAPTQIFFYEAKRTFIGTKFSLVGNIHSNIRISGNRLLRPKQARLAGKISWASLGSTTSLEDEDYGLMDLFVNMPLLYGSRLNHDSSLDVLQLPQ